MTNKEKYKTPEERQQAFHKMCESHKACVTCPALNKKWDDDRVICAFTWLDLEADEEDNND